MSTVGIAIVNYLSADDTAALVRSIAAHTSPTGPQVAIAIVDNSDQRQRLEPIAEVARGHGLSARVIHGHGNVGYAAGNNIGARWLLEQGADVVWVLNPDTRITGGDLSAALEVCRAGDFAIGATTSTDAAGVTRPELGALDLWTGQSGQPSADSAGSRRLTYVAGHSILITRPAFEKLNGFTEDFFLFYEEADLAVRSERLGIPVTVVSGLEVEHAGGGATGASRDMKAKSLITYFHASRSCMIFFRRHYGRRLPVAAFARLLYAGKALLVAGPGAASAVVRGTVAGLRA
ncbi:glycosyltransferase family 2 protein [Micromonospora sp. C28SCA-DRY-2]|uniref:glycosyltransferase family 2 protein n=1 Tax=Micromonospora sp. C28SCA-DRY-2 TaxID=3059522 RepID=UPI00267550CF|nr:glycosyltransferase family 2 protein [Micromonospora sp. C28SCA-DRY-2]MDO3700854.1 glycosyltransferase family 2 protein [Micromonospora sp. C28SCA-DRY-2]